MDAARSLLERGASTHEAGAALGIPATTIGRWARGATASFGPAVVLLPWRPDEHATYAYLLGLYLGDGHLNVDRRGRRTLRIFLDGAYPGIVDECVVAVQAVSGGSASIYLARDSRVR